MVQSPAPSSRKPCFQALVTAFAHDQRGATAIEYALIATLIAVVIIGAVTSMASNLGAMFNTTAEAVQ